MSARFPFALSWGAVALLCCLLATGSAPRAAGTAEAPAGSLDPSFGDGGRISGFSFAGRRLRLSAVVAQPDGKLVAAASELRPGFGPAGVLKPSNAIALVRFDAD